MSAAHRDWRLLVGDIIEYATEIERMTAGMDEAAFSADRTVQFAVTHCVEIMGEAARHVPPDIQARCPDVGCQPGQALSGPRDDPDPNPNRIVRDAVRQQIERGDGNGDADEHSCW